MLYVVPTPIGNLRDITLRAIEILKDVDFILAEDTRRTGRLLSHLDIDKKLVVYHDRNKERKTPSIIEDLHSGKDIALVSDAGTPGISDPGFYIVRECIRNNIPVTPLPGPNAAITALVGSGLPTDRFTFYGFLPKTSGRRTKDLQEIKERGETAILYESPHRIEKMLRAIAEVMPEAQVVLAREISKKFENYIRGNADEVLEHVLKNKVKGEITLVISP